MRTLHLVYCICSYSASRVAYGRAGVGRSAAANGRASFREPATAQLISLPAHARHLTPSLPSLSSPYTQRPTLRATAHGGPHRAAPAARAGLSRFRQMARSEYLRREGGVVLRHM